jgi:hypothetical protein
MGAVMELMVQSNALIHSRLDTINEPKSNSASVKTSFAPNRAPQLKAEIDLQTFVPKFRNALVERGWDLAMNPAIPAEDVPPQTMQLATTLFIGAISTFQDNGHSVYPFNLSIHDVETSNVRDLVAMMETRFAGNHARYQKENFGAIRAVSCQRVKTFQDLTVAWSEMQALLHRAISIDPYSYSHHILGAFISDLFGSYQSCTDYDTRTRMEVLWVEHERSLVGRDVHDLHSKALETMGNFARRLLTAARPEIQAKPKSASTHGWTVVSRNKSERSGGKVSYATVAQTITPPATRLRQTPARECKHCGKMGSHSAVECMGRCKTCHLKHPGEACSQFRVSSTRHSCTLDMDDSSM